MLQHTTRFVDGVPCEGRDTPAAERALWTFSREEHAAEAFLALIDGAPPAGKLFALCGLFDADREAFRVEAARFRDVIQTVPVRFGCVEGDVPFGYVVEWSRGPAVRLNATLRTVDAWFAAHPELATLDIVGGGYPQSLREERWEGVQLGTKEARGALWRPGAFVTTRTIGSFAMETWPVAAVRKLVRDGEIEVLVDVSENAETYAGRLYALCGLRVLDLDAFERQAARLLDESGGTPRVRIGCIRASVASLVGRIRQGDAVRELLTDS